MANQCLILTAIFGEESEYNSNSAAGAFATFSFFLFMIYSIFGGMLAVFRADLIQDEPLPQVTVTGGGENIVGKRVITLLNSALAASP